MVKPCHSFRASGTARKAGINMPRHASRHSRRWWGVCGHTLKPRLSTGAQAKVIPGFSRAATRCGRRPKVDSGNRSRHSAWWWWWHDAETFRFDWRGWILGAVDEDKDEERGTSLMFDFDAEICIIVMVMAWLETTRTPADIRKLMSKWWQAYLRSFRAYFWYSRIKKDIHKSIQKHWYV